MPPIAAESDPQSTRALKPVTASANATTSVAVPVRPCAALTSADLQRGDLTGRRLGPYELGERIGQGGMGQVFLARHQALGKQFAIKFLAGSIQRNPEAERRFQEEITSLGKLQHPNILNAVDAGRAGDVHYLVTEYVDGQDLAELVTEHGPLNPARACDFIRQAANGLACAHALGFVHRDIKPSNLMIDAHGTLRLLDFGLVRNQQDTDGLTSAGQLLGTIDFLSPEQAADGRSADARSDLYSIGCTLLFLLTGKPPFSGDQFASVAAKIHGHLFVTPPALTDSENSKTRGLIPAELLEILHRLLNKNPADRFQSARELIEALDRQTDECLERRLPAGYRPTSQPSRKRSAMLRTWGKRLSITVVALLALLTAGPLRSVHRAARISEDAAIVRAPVPGSASDVKTELENSNDAPSPAVVAEPTLVPPDEPESLPEAVVDVETQTVSADSTTSENQSEADAGISQDSESDPGDAAVTSEFRSAGNVSARRMELPGKLLSGKAGGLLRSGRQKSQEE